MAKFILPDNSPQNKQRMAAASGAYPSPAPPSSSMQKNGYPQSQVVNLPITKNAQFAGSGANVAMTQPMFFSPLHTPQNWQIASRRREIMQWSRFYYMNEPKVAAGVDFYSNFSMNGFKLECKSKKILKFYERLVEKIDLAEKLNAISHEYFLLGDVFPFAEIECPHCKGKGRKLDGQMCNHADGTFKSIKLMNPDYIDVRDNPLASNPEFYLVPDEELKLVVARKEPKSIYDSLPAGLIRAVSSGQPMRLSDRCISHLKHNASDYGTYGTSMLQRLFTVLAYKTKIMTANWIVAERLILPVRVVKVGDKDRPATSSDLQDVQNQLSAVANDPNMTIVTHHSFDYEWYGATGKIHNITAEIEQVGKEILDGLMLNQAILNGEMAGYCVSADTTTLCDSGFKYYWEIDPKKDKIACYNPETREIEYHLPYEKVVYDYEGEMVHFNTDKIDILVTPNHRMWSAKRDSNEYKFTRAEDIRPRAKFIGAADGFVGEYQKTVQIGEEEYSIYDFCKLVGYYVSEGWLSWHKYSGEKTYTSVRIGQNRNGKAREDIENLFYSSFDEESIRNRNDYMDILNKDLAFYLNDNFGSGAINKKLSPFVKNLTSECLEIIIEAMINGDGCIHNHIGENRKVKGESYYTSSKQLAEDFAEIAFKCGYVVKIREHNKKKNSKKYFNKTGHQYKTNHQQYVVYISKGFKGRNPTLCSKSKKYAGKEITRVPYSGKIYCFSVPHELFVTMRNGIVTIQGNTSAQVGIEVLIRRLDNWRNKLQAWVETNLFKPVAMMQGFIDEEESKEVGETVYLYPKLTWNDLQLRDKTNRIQTLMQMYDKGMVSAQTVLEEMDLDYDSEVEKIREEQVMASATGMVGGADQAGNLGTMGMGGAPMGGDMGGGMPPEAGGEMMPSLQGGMGGDMGGAPAGGAGGGPPMGAAASGALPVIGKRGSQKQQEEQQAPPPKMIKLTKLEQKMFRTLSAMDTNHDLFAQYQVKVPGEARPYAIDFAYPKIGVGIEVDGAIWHEREDFQQRDLNRDQKLANVGWRVLRFNEDSVNENIDAVRDTIAKHVADASKSKKKAEDEALIKTASVEDWLNPLYEYCLSKGKIGCSRASIPHGQILYIGNLENGDTT
jgi:very-short-patch-repair endonuclease